MFHGVHTFFSLKNTKSFEKHGSEIFNWNSQETFINVYNINAWSQNVKILLFAFYFEITIILNYRAS